MNHDTNNHFMDVQNFKCMRLVATLLKNEMENGWTLVDETEH